MPTPSLRIFISSTSVDLQEHRQAVFDLIMQSGEYAIDMKYFGSRPKDPETVCREAIEQADILVGIYAWRYGWVPDGEARSITEMEFDYARARGIPCLCYVVKKNHPWNPEWIEGSSAREKLEQFKQKVGALVRTEFTTANQLAGRVIADLSREKDAFRADQVAGEPPPEDNRSWQDVFSQLPLDAEALDLFHTVNCDRLEHFQRRLDDHYKRHRNGDHHLVYFISACPLQNPGSLARRLIYWHSPPENPEFSRFFETDGKPGEVHVQPLPIRPTPEGSWASCWSLVARFGLRDERLLLDDFIREKNRFLVADKRIACTFSIKENAWNSAAVDGHLKHICGELEKLPAGARRFVFFFILEFSRAETGGHQDRDPECDARLQALDRLVTDLSAGPGAGQYAHISLLPAVPRRDVGAWLREVMPDARDAQVDEPLEKLNHSRSAEERQADRYNMERVEDMQYQAYLLAQR